MSDNNKRNTHRRDHPAERWARAFGVSTERFTALINEVSEERQALGNRSRRSREHRRPRPGGSGLE